MVSLLVTHVTHSHTAYTSVFALFCVLMSVCALVGSILVLTHNYAGNAFGEPVWPGVAVLLQNILLFLATLVMRGSLIASATY